MTDEQNPVISPPSEKPEPETPAVEIKAAEIKTVSQETDTSSSLSPASPVPPAPPAPPASPVSELPSSAPAPSDAAPGSFPHTEHTDAKHTGTEHTDVQTSLLSEDESAAAPAADAAADSGTKPPAAEQPQTEGSGNGGPVKGEPVPDEPVKAEPVKAESANEDSLKEEPPGKDPPKEDLQKEDPPKEEPPQRPSSGLFKKFITENKIFKNREVLRHSYSPRELPHRDEQIDSIAEILAPALQGATPSNILIYGKTGTGKTATVKYVGGELENESSGFTPCRLIHLNCETIDTQYRVLAQIANCVSEIDNKASDRVKNIIPPTGWHTDQVYSELKNILEHAGGLQIIVLDEIDKLVKKSGDDTLYSLTRINSDLTRSRVCIIGISNDLTFKDFLDPRVLSSLSEEELVFPPYNAAQLADILKQRAKTAFLEGAVSDDVISLCAARAAQEHGDARRALDLLRVSGEFAEREGASYVEERHVATAQESIETDTMSECVRTLPVQSKIVLSSMLLLAGSGQKVFTSGQVVGFYRDLVKELEADCLSHRRVSELINDLTMLGIVSSRVVSYGRHGRTTEIYFDKPTNEIRRVIMNEPRFMECGMLESLMR